MRGGGSRVEGGGKIEVRVFSMAGCYLFFSRVWFFDGGSCGFFVGIFFYFWFCREGGLREGM